MAVLYNKSSVIDFNKSQEFERRYAKLFFPVYSISKVAITADFYVRKCEMFSGTDLSFKQRPWIFTASYFLIMIFSTGCFCRDPDISPFDKRAMTVCLVKSVEFS